MWGPPGADRTQVGPMLSTWTLLSGYSWDLEALTCIMVLYVFSCNEPRWNGINFSWFMKYVKLIKIVCLNEWNIWVLTWFLWILVQWHLWHRGTMMIAGNFSWLNEKTWTISPMDCVIYNQNDRKWHGLLLNHHDEIHTCDQISYIRLWCSTNEMLWDFTKFFQTLWIMSFSQQRWGWFIGIQRNLEETVSNCISNEPADGLALWC